MDPPCYAALVMKKTAEKNRKELLFDGFTRTSKEIWKKTAEKSLRGGTSYEDLVWRTEDGIMVEPLYTEEEAEDFPVGEESLPGEFPFTRGTRAGKNDWLVTEEINAADTRKAALRARTAADGGAEHVIFLLDEKTEREGIAALAESTAPRGVEVSFAPAKDPLPAAAVLASRDADRRTDEDGLRGSVFFDPLSRLSAGEIFLSELDDGLEKIAETIRSFSNVSRGRGAFTVKSGTFKDSGATVIQELAFTLAAAAEYLVRLGRLGIDADGACTRLVFCFSVGSGYFEEIAKLRAARTLWTNVVERFDPTDLSAGKMKIHCRTSKFNKTLYDPHVNILRATTEALAAVTGGTDSLAVDFFDLGRADDEFSRRTARNIQLLIKNECRLDAVADPGGGSYHLEKLTGEIARKSLELFKRVETEGGYVECLKNGFIQDSVEKSRKKTLRDVSEKKKILVGTNEFPNPEEKPPEGVPEKNRTEKPADTAGTAIRPLLETRASRDVEEARAREGSR